MRSPAPGQAYAVQQGGGAVVTGADGQQGPGPAEADAQPDVVRRTEERVGLGQQAEGLAATAQVAGAGRGPERAGPLLLGRNGRHLLEQRVAEALSPVPLPALHVRRQQHDLGLDPFGPGRVEGVGGAGGVLREGDGLRQVPRAPVEVGEFDRGPGAHERRGGGDRVVEQLQQGRLALGVGSEPVEHGGQFPAGLPAHLVEPAVTGLPDDGLQLAPGRGPVPGQLAGAGGDQQAHELEPVGALLVLGLGLGQFLERHPEPPGDDLGRLEAGDPMTALHQRDVAGRDALSGEISLGQTLDATSLPNTFPECWLFDRQGSARCVVEGRMNIYGV